MTSDLQERVRAGLHSYAAATDAVPPPVQRIRDRAANPTPMRRAVRRRLAWFAIPVVAVAAGGVAIATGGARDVANEKFAEANLWNPEWDIPVANQTLVAADTAADGTEVQYWVGVSAKHAPARCELLLFRRPGGSWRANGSACTAANTPQRSPDSPLGPTIGRTPMDDDYRAMADTDFSMWGFHVPRGTQKLVVTIDDGTQRVVVVTTPGYALVVVPAKRMATRAVAVDAAGTAIDTVPIPDPAPRDW